MVFSLIFILAGLNLVFGYIARQDLEKIIIPKLINLIDVIKRGAAIFGVSVSSVLNSYSNPIFRRSIYRLVKRAQIKSFAQFLPSRIYLIV